MAKQPKTLPRLPHGMGSLGYDAARRQITLRHRWNGRPWIERGESIAECERKRDRRRRDMDMRAGLAGDGTLGGLLEGWFEFEVASCKAVDTLKGYRNTINHLDRHLGTDVATHDIGVQAWEDMLAAVVGAGLGTASLGKLRTHVGMALAFGLRRSLVPASVLDAWRVAKAPQMPALDSRHVWFDLDDYAVVRSHFIRDRQCRNILFAVMLLCGLRPGEALGLKWEYVDLGRRVLRVEGRIERRNQPEWSPVLKTDHLHRFAHRSVPIPADLALVLAERPRDDELVFIEDTGRAKGRLVRFDAMQDHARATASNLRVQYVNPNGYRHSFASMCRHNHMPYEVLAKLMGHKDTREIIATYGHPMVDAASVDLDRYLGTPEGGAGVG